MTILADNEILSRLHSLPDETPPNYLDLVSQGHIPQELETLLREGWIIIDPPPQRDAIGPCTIDLSFGNWIETKRAVFEISVHDGHRIIRLYTYDARNTQPLLLEHDRVVEITEHGTNIKFLLCDNETFELPPGFFLTAPTKERVHVPTNLVMKLGGRSTYARKGITIELSSDRFDPGWCGVAVMEIANVGQAAFNLFPGLPLCCVTFEQLSSHVAVPYFAKKNAAFRGQQ